MKRLMWILMALTLLLSGCKATSVMVGHTETDLSKIQLGDQRSQVEKVLGKRLWRLGLDGGRTYDIYQYKASQPPQPIYGALYLGLDYVSLGLYELPMNTLVESYPVKQVCIAYDEQDIVRFVSQPWSVSRNVVGPCKRMRTLLPANSGIPLAARTPTVGTNQFGSKSTLATLEVDPDSHTSGTIGSHSLEWNSSSSKPNFVELPPGLHTFDINNGGSFDLELLPGRIYRLKYYILQPDSPPYCIYVEDVDSGETIQCYWHRFGWLGPPYFKPINAIPVNKGVVYIYSRTGFEDTRLQVVTTNGKPITKIKKGGYFPYVSELGVVHFEFRVGTEPIREVNIKVEAGTEKYLKAEYPKFSEVSPELGSLEIGPCSLLKPFPLERE